MNMIIIIPDMEYVFHVPWDNYYNTYFMKGEKDMEQNTVTQREMDDGRTVAIGDRIRFRAVARFGTRSIWRKVRGFVFCRSRGWCPIVTAYEWDNFIAYPSEISQIERKAATGD